MDADAWDTRYRDADLVWGHEPNQFVRAQCEGLPPGTAVDLACGEGRNALWLARQGWQPTGIDYSPVAIERARELTSREEPEVARRLRWHVGDVTTLRLDARSVDLAVISYLHVPPDQSATVVMAACDAVRAGGHLVIVGHDRRNLREGVAGPQDETLLLGAETLRETVEWVSGMTVELAETVERRTDAGTALDTLLRAVRD
ncbi:MAG: class I SAM-dependent methyltransferase [Propionibacteriales bacterium]|nr:class I SAM-dependent methyltransferase [Propionibacteriales bacterium]